METNSVNPNEMKQTPQKNYKALKKAFEKSREKVHADMLNSFNRKSDSAKGTLEEGKETHLPDDDLNLENVTVGNNMRANYNEYILSGGDNCLYPESENYQMSYQRYRKTRHIPEPLQHIAFFFVILLKAIFSESVGMWGFLYLCGGIIVYFEMKSFGILMILTSFIPLYLAYKVAKEDYLKKNV